MINKIVITGPESTGKTTLAKGLAKKYNAPMVDEYARIYLAELCKKYTFEDVLKMAKKQLQNEVEACQNSNQLIFIDTDLLVFKIWIKEKYNREIDWINSELEKVNNKVYLLCDIDVKWEADRLREHPNIEDRKRLFNAYEQNLKILGLKYEVVSGTIEERIDKCEAIINSTIQLIG